MNTTHEQQAPAAPRGDALDRAFAWLRSLGIMRDPSDRWIGGVASGVAHRLGVDPVIVRVVLVLLGVFGGIGVTLYLLAWALLPDTRGELLAESAIRHGDGWAIVLLVAAGLSLGGLTVFDEGGWKLGWVIPALIIGGFFVHRARSGSSCSSGRSGGDATVAPPPPTWAGDASTTTTDSGPTDTGSLWRHVDETGPVGTDPARPQPAPPAPPRPQKKKRRRGMGLAATLLTLGLALAAAGLGRVLDEPIGFPGTADVLGRLFALGVIALGVIVAALRGRTSGFAGVVGVILAVSTAFTIGLAQLGINGINLEGGMGDQVYRPTGTQTEFSYNNGVGDSLLDLSGLSSTPTTPATVSIQSGMGDVTVEYPKGLTVKVEGDLGLGEVRDGAGRLVAADQVIGEGTPDVTVKADLGVGNLILKEK